MFNSRYAEIKLVLLWLTQKKQDILHVTIDLNVHFITEPKSSSPTENNRSQSQSPITSKLSPLFSRITQHAYDTGHAQTVDDELRSASVSAPKLVKALKLNEALGYVDIKNMNSRGLYKLLDDCYHLAFGEDNFRKYRAK